MALVRLHTVKEELGLDLGSKSDDRWIARQLRAAQSEIEGPRFCHQPIAYAAYEYTFQVPQGLDSFVLPFHPVWSVEELSSKGSLRESSWTTITGAIVEKVNGLYYLVPQSFFQRGSYYRAVLMIGYAEPDDDSPPEDIPAVPMGLQDVVIDMLEHVHKQRRGDRFGLKQESQSVEGTSMSLSRVFTTDVERTHQWRDELGPYTRRPDP